MLTARTVTQTVWSTYVVELSGIFSVDDVATVIAEIATPSRRVDLSWREQAAVNGPPHQVQNAKRKPPNWHRRKTTERERHSALIL